jgi:predicted nucleotide-binding protein
MARRKSIPKAKPPAPNLIIPRTEAESKIYDRVTSGKELLELSINNENDLEAARAQRKKWNDYNEELLKRIFDSEAVFEDYNRSSLFGTLIMNASLRQRISSFYEGVSNKITALESIIEKLELIPEKVTISGPQERCEPEISDTVFVVHGHDDEAKVSVARFIEKLGLKAVILHEQPNAGQTIIEKFERHATISGYAVVILTPDDIGASNEAPDDAKHRARQNVILELGYFCGALGRAKISVLVKEGVEIPSDYLGVVYTPMDPGGGWQLSLAKDMKSAGLPFDANRVF